MSLIPQKTIIGPAGITVPSARNLDSQRLSQLEGEGSVIDGVTVQAVALEEVPVVTDFALASHFQVLPRMAIPIDAALTPNTAANSL